MGKISIPTTLLQNVAAGEAALFLGAGANRGAIGPLPDDKMPMGNKLRDLACDEFLSGACKDRGLAASPDTR
jgi:hypothetical protein